jgi:type II secretory pathway pseudopilin PulG
MGQSGNFSIARDQRGYTLMEAMIAASLLGFMALALVPAMMNMLDGLKVQTFRSLCTSIVRAKLQEYVSGVGASAGVGVNPVALGYTPSGFEYSKLRFQQNAAECPTTVGSPGFREYINSNKIVADNASQETDSTGVTVPGRMTGFQLYVNLRQYNPRVLSSGQPTRQCPDSTYQFYRLGDGIEVVVTGMLRVRPAYSAGGRGGARWGKLDDQDNNTPNPMLVCSASQVVYPPHLPFRYYMGSDGKIRNYLAAMASAATGAPPEAMEAHFRSLWMYNNVVLSNIRSFAVSPENNYVYILRSGSLARYGPCEDKTVTVNGINFDGVPDCPAAPEHVYAPLDPNIESVTVDFQDLTDTSDDLVYGLFNTGSTAAAGQSPIRRLDLSSSEWVDSTTFSLPSNRPRVKGIFLAPTFPAAPGTVPSLYFLDNTCYSSAGGTMSSTSYCVSIFNSADQDMARDVRELPIQVQAVSY